MRPIAVVTGTRADYGLLRPLLLRLSSDTDIELQLLVTGTHLSPKFGETWQEIAKDNVPITTKINILTDDDIDNSCSYSDSNKHSSKNNSHLSVAVSVGKGIKEFAITYSQLLPEMIVILGDRYEIFAAAQAALLMNIPIVHIHGGEITEGAIDDSMRHAITKMSSLHFVATERYKQRVTQMGEQPESVYNVGSLGLETINNMLNESALLSQNQLQSHLGFSLQQPLVLVTYHAETLSSLSIKEQAEHIFTAIENNPNAFYLFTAPNADAGGLELLERIQQFVNKNTNNTLLVKSLGQQLYFSVLKIATAVLGNSSSGIIEVPAFGIPTIDIGDRQLGREKGPSITAVPCHKDQLSQAIKVTLEAKADYDPTTNPYANTDSQLTSKKIQEILKSFDSNKGCRKRFYDKP